MIKKIIFILVLSLNLISCGSNNSNNNNTIKIGSKNFTESLIVSEIYAQSLEKANLKVERIFNISGNLIHNALINKEIDIYPEYTGTGLLAILKKEVKTNPQEVYDIVSKEYKEKFNVKWLNLTTSNDSNGIAIRTDIAKKYGIYSLSDLQKNADKIRFASQGEFHIREDALPMLEKIYGKFNFKSFKVYSNELKYKVLDENLTDATIVYTTEGNLVKKDKYTILEDDKYAFPPYNLVAVVRIDTLKKYSQIEKILNDIDKKLTSEVLIKLNAKVDIEHMNYEEVATEFLNESKSIK